MKRSQDVERAIKAMYALLAKAAAKKAVSRVEWDDTVGADKWMSSVERWLEKAGANATRWHFEKPKV